MGQNKGGCFLEYVPLPFPRGAEVLYDTCTLHLLPLPPQPGSVLRCPSYLPSSIPTQKSLCFYPLS